MLKGNIFNVHFDKQDEHEVIARFENSAVNLGEDFAFNYGVSVPQTSDDGLLLIARLRLSGRKSFAIQAGHNPNPDGYFEAAAVFNEAKRSARRALVTKPRSIVLMLDTSLSMQWEKLQKSYEAIELFFEIVDSRRHIKCHSV